MEGGNMALLQNERLPSSCSSLEVLDSLWISNSSPPPPPPFHASRMVNFSEAEGENSRKREKSFFPQEEENSGNENFDGYFHHPEKKRRLTADQVQFLEKSFEVENKLEPERKVQLAKELGLQPRQVAIWFQNRRARYKTKQLEKEYDSLKSSFDKLNADYDSLFKENEKLKNEVKLLTEKLLMREKEKGKSKTCDSLCGFNIEPDEKQLASNSAVCLPGIKQEDAASSAKSDVFDSDSPHCTDGNHSSNVFEAELSDFSQDEDDNLSISLLQPSLCFPKLEEECYDELQPNSSNLGFSIEDQASWFWSY